MIAVSAPVLMLAATRHQNRNSWSGANAAISAAML
jgi:hypothetical protein